MADPAETYAATFTAAWPTLQLDASGAEPGATIRPSLSDSDGAQERAIQVLLPTPSSSDAVKHFGTTLGEGGMGLVRLAEQSSMQRQVAVKSLRKDAVRPQIARRLLQEAWITGYLEHPNIVPVYDIAQDESRRPVILMKRIEGRTWDQLSRDADAVHEAFGAADLQEWNLRIFLTVCNAAHYAHEHGVLHRDIKPENIMIGRFGEVYLLDWGIAVALDQRHEGRLPLAAKERRLAGTPRFMAPEMAVVEGAKLSPATDVYLLGATLYAALTGRAPHQGEDLEQLLKSIAEFVPRFGDDVPEALARVVRRAMAVSPQDRYDSVDALAKAVVRYLERRGSIALTSNGLAHVAEMVGQQDADQVQVLYSQATFALQQALRSWPDNRDAAQGLRRCHEVRIDDAVQRRMIGAARGALAQIDDPERTKKVEALATELAAEAAELEALRQAADPTVGIRTRMFVIAIVAVLWILMPILGMFSGEMTWNRMFISSLVLLAFFVAVGIWARDSLSKSDLNRGTAFVLLSIPMGQLVFDAVAYLAGVNATAGFSLRQGLWFCFALVYTLVLVPRMWPSTVVIGAMALMGASLPEYANMGGLVSNVSLAANGFFIWGRDLAQAIKKPPERSDS